MTTRLRYFFLCANKLLLVNILTFISTSINATNYYFNQENGNKGVSKSSPWKSVDALSKVQLQPGDSLLFATGQRFIGGLTLNSVKGIQHKKIIIGHYKFKQQTALPIIDAGDSLNAIRLLNCSAIEVNGITITATQLPFVSNTSTTPMRCGILVETNGDGSYGYITLKNLLIHDIYLMPKGFKRTAAETQTANGTQGYGWGVRFINHSNKSLIENIIVDKIEIHSVSHTGLKFTSPTNGIQNVQVANCFIHDTGGPGLQMSGVNNAHINYNQIERSGSIQDTRNWGRGSGMWTWDCKNILIEHNQFMHANGPGDSAGVHIDFNCSDIIIQYNVSAYNAGGFCEILGNNYNCAYRFNVSIDDGHRIKGVNGAFQEGKVFWLSGYIGNNKKSTGPFNSYFYNNTIYSSKSIIPKIAITSSAEGVLIANNIFYFENPAQVVVGDQKKNEKDTSLAKHVLITNNLFLRPDNWPSDIPYKNLNAFIGDSHFSQIGGRHVEDYISKTDIHSIYSGIPIQKLVGDTVGIRIGFEVEKDILGRSIQGKTIIGAISF